MREGFQGIFYCEKSKRNFELFGLFSVLVKGFLKSLSDEWRIGKEYRTACPVLSRQPWGVRPDVDVKQGAGSTCFFRVGIGGDFVGQEKHRLHRRVKEEMHAAWNPGSGER